MKNMLWDYCAKCEARIAVGDDFFEVAGESYCNRCAKKRNVLKEWLLREDSKKSEDTEEGKCQEY